MATKYVAFKVQDWIKEWQQTPDDKETKHPLSDLQNKRIDDAVVIRLQDMFAGPALHTYASSISIALELLPADHPDREGMEEVAAYFYEMAAEADQLKSSSRVKLPD